MKRSKSRWVFVVLGAKEEYIGHILLHPLIGENVNLPAQQALSLAQRPEVWGKLALTVSLSRLEVGEEAFS